MCVYICIYAYDSDPILLIPNLIQLRVCICRSVCVYLCRYMIYTYIDAYIFESIVLIARTRIHIHTHSRLRLLDYESTDHRFGKDYGVSLQNLHYECCLVQAAMTSAANPVNQGPDQEDLTKNKKLSTRFCKWKKEINLPV